MLVKGSSIKVEMEPGEIADEVYFLFMGFLSPSERKKFIIDDPDSDSTGTIYDTINTDKGSDLFYDLEDYFKNLD